MAEKNLKLLKASVGHARLWPKKNAFKYNVFYVKIPVTNENSANMPALYSFNKWNVFSLFEKDHGAKQKGINWYQYITGELKKADIPYNSRYSISLITHPRIFGYAFNPISFWLINDENQNLKAVLCEVTSTFKQTHNYLLSNPDNSPILSEDVLLSDKKLYVSPFNKNEGYYQFSFTDSQDRFKTVINYFDGSGQHILNTYMGGESENLTSGKIIQSLIKYPAMTIMVVLRIQLQAVRLYCKGVSQTVKTRPRNYKNNETTVTKIQKP